MRHSATKPCCYALIWFVITPKQCNNKMNTYALFCAKALPSCSLDRSVALTQNNNSNPGSRHETTAVIFLANLEPQLRLFRGTDWLCTTKWQRQPYLVGFRCRLIIVIVILAGRADYGLAGTAYSGGGVRSHLEQAGASSAVYARWCHSRRLCHDFAAQRLYGSGIYSADVIWPGDLCHQRRRL